MKCQAVFSLRDDTLAAAVVIGTLKIKNSSLNTELGLSKTGVLFPYSGYKSIDHSHSLISAL